MLSGNPAISSYIANSLANKEMMKLSRFLSEKENQLSTSKELVQLASSIPNNVINSLTYLFSDGFNINVNVNVK